MKKRKILYLFPLAALVLSGCTFQEGWDATKTWVSDHIWTPILNLFGGKKSEDSGKKQDGGNTPAPSTDSDTEEIVATEVGSVDNPLTVSQFQTLCDENLASAYDGIEDKKSVTDFAHIAYLKAKVSSNTWNSDGSKIQYLNLVDQTNSSLQVTGMFVVVDQSVTGDYSAKDSLKGLEVVVKGYPALYKKSGAKTYELVSKDKSDSENPRLMKVFAPEPTPGLNYGTLDNPLTVSQAKALIDTENPTAVKAYVTGEIKSNEAYNASYKNVMRITITDGSADLVIFKCGTFPEGFDGTAITANSLKGMTAVAYGIGELYQSTTYELTAPSIISLSGEVTPPTPVDNFGTLDNPLSIAEAKAVIDAQNPTTQEMYVTGTVKSNTAWSTQFNNVDILLADDAGNEFTVWRTATLPDSLQPTLNQLVGKVVVAHGTGKLYNTTYELDQGCVVDKIEDAAPIAVESVVLSAEEHIDLQKGQSVKITASVLPAQASQEVEWSLTGESSRSLLSEGPATYDTETNILTAVDTGRATLTATSVADGTVSASCSIEITEATRELSFIEIIESEPKLAYNAGEEYGHEGLTVQAAYDNGEKADVTDLVDWSYSKATAEVGDDELVVTATYVENEVEKSDSVTLQVTVSDPKGSLTNPYTVEEARAAIDAGEGITDVYASGIVTSIAYAYSSTSKNMSFFFSTTGAAGVELEAYKLSADEDPNIEVGDNVTVRGNLKVYNSTYEFDTGCTLAEHTKPTVVAITISGTPSQTTYGVGDTYNHSGLIATATLDNGGSKNISSLVTWTINPETASATDESIEITASYGNVVSDQFVVNVTITDGPAPTVLDETIKYSGGTTTNMDGSNQASTLGVTDTHISVVGTKVSGSVNVGLNKDGTIRLYKGGSTTLTISVTDGSIASLEITTGTTFDSLSVNGTAVTGAAKSSTFTVNVGASSAVLSNPGTTAQSWFVQIVVHYTLNA